MFWSLILDLQPTYPKTSTFTLSLLDIGYLKLRDAIQVLSGENILVKICSQDL